MGRHVTKGGPVALLLATAASLALAGCTSASGNDRPAVAAAPVGAEEPYVPNH